MTSTQAFPSHPETDTGHATNSVSPPATARRADDESGQFQATSDRVRLLGWGSLGLGVTLLAAPRAVARLAGIAGQGRAAGIIRLVGARELLAGGAVLLPHNPAPGLWARVGGDAMDLALLVGAMAAPGADRRRLAPVTAAVAGLTAADVAASLRASRASTRASSAEQPGVVEAKAAITINAPIEEVYRMWEGFHRLPRFMRSAATVEPTGEGTARWTIPAPAGITLEWDVAVAEARPPEVITWQATGDAPMPLTGEVRFRPAPGELGTEVLMALQVRPPGGGIGQRIGDFAAEAFGVKLSNDLRRAKQLIELGEIVLSDDSAVEGPNPARPPETNHAA